MDPRLAVLIIVAGLGAWGIWRYVRAAGTREPSPSDVVERWVAGRPCVSCGGPVVESRLVGHHIALLDPTGMTHEWVDIAADRLALTLEAAQPMCWNCHVAETFRRLHPELVTERDARVVHVDATEPIARE